jgi:hypothetical protein
VQTFPSGVGKRTVVTIMNRKGRLKYISSPYVEQLRAIWEKEKKSKSPDAALDVIAEMFKKSSFDLEPD